jgi:glycosyltransferase involved in cell wall biosynthesis
VAIEAMACGVPVVARVWSGLAESVLDGVTGIHVRPRSPGDIAAAIRTLVEDEPRRRAMGAAGARRALRFGWDRVAADTLAVLRQLPTPRTATVSAPVGTGTGRAGTRRTTTGRRFT